jgi:hypothetical protein
LLISMLANALRRSRARRTHGRILTGAIAVACLTPATALAAASVTVDLATSYRPATHVGNGFTYGVTEKVPADGDLESLVGALRPTMLTNPASSDPGTQQPGIPANAIKVAARVAPFGTTVTVRLADWFSGWYAFTTMTDWFAKIGTTIAAKKAAKLDNIYAYEIWNEPNGSWTNGGDTNAIPGGTKTLSWNAFWKQSYDKIRQLDASVKITGPSISYMDPDFMKGFLTYCKANDCLPDIIGWHEGVNIETDVANYRTLEKQIGVGPLPITINEYSGLGRAKDEGRPGATVPLIAQLERAGVDSAGVTWWTPDSVAGHMGSLLASDTQPNGGWLLFKWYGDMAGNMVMTTPSLAKDGKNLDGLASLDAAGVTVLVGGISDGTIQVVIKGWKTVASFGGKVHAVVERTRWTGRSGVITSTDTLSSADVAIANDQITVPINNANGDDGHRITLTPVGGAGDAGVDDAGADSGVSRDARDAGSAGAGGRTGGQGGTGGRMTMDAGFDAAAGAGGTIRSGGTTNSGGSGPGTLSSGGARGGALVTTGGPGGMTSNTTETGGPSDAGSGSGGATLASTKTSAGSSGCSCALPGRNAPSAWQVLLLLGLLIRPRNRRVPARPSRKVAIRSFFSGFVSFTAHARPCRIRTRRKGPKSRSTNRDLRTVS